MSRPLRAGAGDEQLRAAGDGPRRGPDHLVRPDQRRRAVRLETDNPEVVDEITTHHSSYYIDHSEAPAPLLIQSGWNDDLFPPDEAIRFYNRTRTQYPGDPISLFFMDDGHARSQNKPADEELFGLARTPGSTTT